MPNRTKDGMSFVVKDAKKLTIEVSPKYFKRQKFESLKRQLSYHGFKVETIKIGRTKCFRFFNPLFQFGKIDLLHAIVRSTKHKSQSPRLHEEVVNLNARITALEEICVQCQHQLQMHSETIDTKYSTKISKHTANYKNSRMNCTNAANQNHEVHVSGKITGQNPEIAPTARNYCFHYSQDGQRAREIAEPEHSRMFAGNTLSRIPVTAQKTPVPSASHNSAPPQQSGTFFNPDQPSGSGESSSETDWILQKWIEESL